MKDAYERNVDELGRVVLPVDYRSALGLRDSVLIRLVGDEIRISRLEPSCSICGGQEDVTRFLGTCLCHSCISQIQAIEK